MNFKSIIVFCLIISCKNKDIIPLERGNKYAELFKVEYKNDTSFISTFNGNKLESSVFFRKPPDKIVIFSSSHLGFIKALNQEKRVKAVSNKNYFYNSTISREEILELGDIDKLNIELLLAINPDLVLLLPTTQPNKNVINILKKAKIPFLITTDYLEKNPLATAEWIKLYGAIFKCKDRADSIFNLVEQNYTKIKNRKKLDTIPTVMTGFPWQNQWFVSSNTSYLATLIKDAGGHYFFNKTIKNNVQLSHEDVLKYSKNASYWVNISTLNTKNDMKISYSLSEQMPPFLNDKCYNNTNLVQTNGANDYWEMGVVRPDLILNDLYQIFNQEKNPHLVFYKKMK